MYSSMTAFTQKVYQILRTIPAGKVVTYGQLASLAGYPGASRAVGRAMANNPNAPATPCHRVVASGGSLHGYSGKGGLAKKRALLENEGVIFVGEKVDLGQCRYKNDRFTDTQSYR